MIAQTRPGPAGRPLRKLSRTAVNFIVDIVLLLVFLALAWITTVLRFVFPAPTAAAGWTLWGWGYDRWSAFQFNVLCLFALTVLLHVMLHWSWVCGVVAARLPRRNGQPARQPDDGIRTLYGVGTLIAIANLLGLLLAAAALSIVPPP
jgi:hypothetical protein